jgi:MoaA/NifB/PqqE/SkfB family radical SAM enzyme
LTPTQWLAAWGTILKGHAPMLSIEITRECPLSCPGCYAYNDDHLGGGIKLSELRDFRGDELVSGVIGLVERHKPLHVSLVGGEPLVRHKELSRILPVLSKKGTFTLVVTSAVIPIPIEWMQLDRLTVAVSVDGLPADHDVRRKPATYERILHNIEGRRVNIHTTITQQMLNQTGYLDEFFAFWSARAEVNRFWVSFYTPQVGEVSPESITPECRQSLVHLLPELRKKFPKILMTEGYAQAFLEPPKNPSECTFARMSVNYSADLKSRVEPCIFGGEPDCSTCGCAVSAGLHWAGNLKIIGPLSVGHLVKSSVVIGTTVNRMRTRSGDGHTRWTGTSSRPDPKLTQIQL